MTNLKRFLRNEDGATAIEYGLIAALIGAAIIASLTALGGGNGAMWGDIQTDVTAALG